MHTTCLLLATLTLTLLGQQQLTWSIGQVANVNAMEMIELELKRTPNKLAYCQWLEQQLERPFLLSTSCATILNENLDTALTAELLMDSKQRCWWGAEMFGRRCRKRA
ncbi:uncharacterized protein LOC115631901 [Scaptodrosophila lebanonensis]|uniref:Uncharacterized protein LOC115631901 n=1 Tax=Drosophila lebanonensis TaxID=7225 RepID=A0A6J2U9D4_DROLE|nr:uncharacterized protein LOC115631901 [Scaptodrosophila lebanonensis]